MLYLFFKTMTPREARRKLYTGGKKTNQLGCLLDCAKMIIDENLLSIAYLVAI